MKQAQSTLSSKNQVVIPAPIRKALNLKAGDIISWQVVASTTDAPKVVAQAAPEKWAEHTRGLGQTLWQETDISAYIEKLREEWQNQA